MKKVLTFGEMMLRLTPGAYHRFVQADHYEASYGGGEANVAVSLAHYGMDAIYITKLPNHEIGQAGINYLRQYGVDTSQIIRGGDRVGIYYLEKGASQRPSKVIYDRAYSAISLATVDEFDWDSLFDGVDHFHFTGITPAVSPNLAEICLRAVQVAKARSISVSCDLNYRKNLWTREEAGQVMATLMPYVDICIANEEDAADVFGIHAGKSDVSRGDLDHEAYEEVAATLASRFGIQTVAITLRESISANDNNWAGLLYEEGKAYFSKSYPIHIVDRVGGGDSFGAGLIYATAQAYSPQERIEFAVAASCLKQTIEADFNLVSVEEVLQLAKGDGSGRIRR